MTRIFISHSHSDEAIAYQLFDFLLCALRLEDDDILCTSDPGAGLSFNSNSISDQLKNNLQQADALIVLITVDSLRSPWIPFEVGSFWPTDKPIVLLLGPGLFPDQLPGPLKGWLSIRIEDEQALDQLNAAINQLERHLSVPQKVNRRRDRKINDFIEGFSAWQSQLPAPDQSQQKQIELLTKQLEDLEQLHRDQLQKIETDYQQEKQALEQSLQSQIKQLEQGLDREKSQVYQQQTNLLSVQEELVEKEALISQLTAQLKQHSPASKVPMIREVELKSEKGIDYTKLQQLLETGMWKEADQETGTVMCQIAADGESKDMLDINDLHDFPCEDLHTINQLWLYYSHGKFGFSVQQSIYQALGGTTKYNEDIWEKFGVKVGWRRKNKWLNYTELKFEIEAHYGHLPARDFYFSSASYRSGYNLFGVIGSVNLKESLLLQSALSKRLLDCNVCGAKEVSSH